MPKTCPGDANLDGAVDIGDITKVEMIILTLDPETVSCDANGDGRINMGDVVKMELIILGIASTSSRSPLWRYLLF
jgi:hypothetical protein